MADGNGKRPRLFGAGGQPLNAPDPAESDSDAEVLALHARVHRLEKTLSAMGRALTSQQQALVLLERTSLGGRWRRIREAVRDRVAQLRARTAPSTAPRPELDNPEAMPKP